MEMEDETRGRCVLMCKVTIIMMMSMMMIMMSMLMLAMTMVIMMIMVNVDSALPRECEEDERKI